MPNSTPVAIYLRVSTELQVDRDSLSNQQKVLEDYARGKHLPYDLFCDAGLSARDTDRPEFQRMMSSLDGYQAVVVTALDRISRNLKDLLEILDTLDQAGVALVSLTQQLDTNTPMGRFFVHQLGSIGQLEREMTAERVAGAMRTRARRKLWNGGPIPYGFQHDKKRKTIIPDEQESEMVRTMYRLYEETGSFRGTVHTLNSQGHRTRTGQFWPTQTVKRILTNPIYCGALAYNRRKASGKGSQPRPPDEHIIVPEVFESIVSQEQFDRVQKTIEGNRSIPPATKGSTYLLSGLVTCGLCDSRMYGITHRRRGRTYGYYRCNGHIQKGPAYCKGNSVRVDDLESLLVDELKSFRTRPDRLIDRAKVAEGGVRELEQQRDSLGRQLSTLDHRIERILDAYQDDLIDKELFRKRIDSLQAERSELRDSITQTEARLEGFRQPDYESTAQALGSLADAMEDLDTRDQQRLLRTLVSDVTVQRHHIDCSVISLPSDLVDWNRTDRGSWPQPT